MEIQLKKGKQKRLTTQLTLESETVNQLRKNIALSLLIGGYNSLRIYSSKDGRPIDLDKLEEFKSKFNELISEVEHEMNVNFIEVDNF